MRFTELLNIFKEHMAGVNLPLVIFISAVLSIAFLIVLWRYGEGVSMAMLFILVGLQLIDSAAVAGMVLMARYPIVILLLLYAIFARKNKIRWSPVSFFLLLVPIVMMFNSVRSIAWFDSLGLSIVFLLFFISIVLGGQKILGDAHGRAVFVKMLMFFSVFMSCIQIPFFSSTQGRLEGTFSNAVGFMTVGMVGTVLLVWLAMNCKLWSPSFLFYLIFASASFILLLLTAGRTALGATALGVLCVLARKLKRNVVVFLAIGIICGPIILRIAVSFPGFEAVKGKLFSTRSSGRAQLFADAWGEIKAKPYIGWGTNMSSIKALTAEGKEYHNTWLMYAVDHGIPFAFFIMCVFLWLPLRGLLLMKRCQTEEMKDMANLSAAIMAGYVFSSFLGGGALATTGILPIYAAIALQEGVRAEQQKIALAGEQDYLDGYDYSPLNETGYSDEGTLYG